MSDTPLNRLTPEDRYRRDVTFRTLVDTMTHMIIDCQFTPTELREAAMLAAILYETRYARREVVLGPEQAARIMENARHCTCHTPTRLGFCPVHEADRL
jgi:hypothetical protein